MRRPRVMVAGKQHDRHGESVEDFESPGDDRAVELVGFEHVSADEDELRARLGGERSDAGNGVEAGAMVPGPGLVAEVVRGHAELPVPVAMNLICSSSIGPILRSQAHTIGRH